MDIQISNGAVTARNSKHTPRCIDVSSHLTSREIEVQAQFWPVTPKNSESYITLKIEANEMRFEIPENEKDSFVRRSTEQCTFISIEQAREIHKRIGEAIDCADVK